MKKAAQLVARTLEATGVLNALERMDHAGELRVLEYHRIDEPSAEPDLDPGLISATPREFRSQMELIAERYNVVSIRTVIAAQRGEERLPAGAVLITFDDGYQDFAVHAWPVLREFNLPAVLFVPTAFPDQSDGAGFWWDRLYAGLRRSDDDIVRLPDLGEFDLAEPSGRRSALRACVRHVKSLPHSEAMQWVASAIDSLGGVPPIPGVIGWEGLRELARQGADVCAHTHLHALSTRLTEAEFAADLTTCKAQLTEELGEGVSAPVLAWPANATSPQTQNVARDLGFEMAFGGCRGVARIPSDDPMNVMRVPVLSYDRALFRAQLRPSIANLGRWIIDAPRRAEV
jgi:peptidoglycan/xylan/chitin deacetylase (PgdA/CDA1 family)